MLLLGIDLGTSFIKVSVIDTDSQSCIASTQYPDTESSILSYQKGWAEQSPDQWWSDVKQAILKLNSSGKYNSRDIKAIGLTYQMHGLVLIDEEGSSLRNSIIWCDSRSISYGNKAFEEIGSNYCCSNLLNSPGNFTAAKLAWVKENEPYVYKKVYKVLLPGDFIGYRLTNQLTTTPAALSEGIFWDFPLHSISDHILKYFDFDTTLFPAVQDVFSNHGVLSNRVASELNLSPGIPLAYKAGDQPNNAFSLNVLEPGEFAATAGTSGVLYGVMNSLPSVCDSSVNHFAHVNHDANTTRIGALLCINGAGIMTRYIKQLITPQLDYVDFDKLAASIEVGSNGLHIFPFGNGAERMFSNRLINAQIENLDLNKHTAAHFCRAVQEGVAYSFKYGFDKMLLNGIRPSRIMAAKANMFLSPVFIDCFVNTIGVPLDLFDVDGSVGAAKGAGVVVGAFSSPNEACALQDAVATIYPSSVSPHQELYHQWLTTLSKHLGK